MSIHFDPKITTNTEGPIKNTSIENENKISIFTDLNNNGIVDESDFNNNEKMLKVVNLYNLLGKKWEEVKDIINHIATMKNSLEQNNVADIYTPCSFLRNRRNSKKKRRKYRYN